MAASVLGSALDLSVVLAQPPRQIVGDADVGSGGDRGDEDVAKVGHVFLKDDNNLLLFKCQGYPSFDSL